MKANEIIFENESRAILETLGIEASDLRDAIWAGEAERNAATPSHPSGHAGYVAWSTTVATLRERLVQKGWQKQDKGNLPTVLSPCGKYVIGVTSGDEATGLSTSTPKSKNPKGHQTQRSIDSNLGQIELFSPEETFRSPTTPSSGPNDAITWFLVFHSDGSEVRFELSLPLSVGEDNRVDDWKTRLIFDAITPSSTPTPDTDVTSFDDLPPIDVPVERRGNG